MRVVLPAPLAPSSPTTSPGAMVRSTLSTAVKRPKSRVTAWVVANGADVVATGPPFVAARPSRLSGAPGDAARRVPLSALRGAASRSFGWVTRPASRNSTAVGALCLVAVAGRDDDAGAVRGHPGDQTPEVRPAHRVDTGGGLVEDQQVRLMQEGQASASFCRMPPERCSAGAGRRPAGRCARGVPASAPRGARHPGRRRAATKAMFSSTLRSA